MRRACSIIFFNIAKDVLRSIELMNHVFHAIQTAIYKYEGQVNKILYDDKGLVCLCAMGLEMGHSDDSIRAVIASLQARDKMEGILLLDFMVISELEVECLIGVASGSVYCGSYGTDQRHDYSVLGKTVNLASR